MKACGMCDKCLNGYPEECYDPLIEGAWEKAKENLFSNKRVSNKSYGKVEKSPFLFERCAHKHKPLPLKDGKVIHGGAASSPVREDHDVYVSLDRFSAHDGKKKPWDAGWKNAVMVSYPITDMSTPSDPTSFKKMIAWLCEQIEAGKSVHVGCIGGHGRTGMVLSAVVKEFTGESDAITYVRKHYCEKAVETKAQAAWLNKHFGIKVVKGHKDGFGHNSYGGSQDSYDFYSSKNKKQGHISTSASNQAASFNSTYVARQTNSEIVGTVDPLAERGNIWGV